MNKILFVGQTPPPFGGQAIMQQVTLEGKYKKIRFVHVRMNFSKEMDEVGKFRLRKVFHLIYIICQIIFMRICHSPKVLYFPPAGPNRIPMYRDIVILCCTRWLFEKTIFHFHAGGISELYRQLNPFTQLLFRFAYFKPDLAIQLSDLNPPDGSFLQAKKSVIIPYGIKDNYPEYNNENGIISKPPTILFVGVIRESKGVLVLLDACRQIKESGLLFRLQLMGHFESVEFQDCVETFIKLHDLNDMVQFMGVCVEEKKWEVYQSADLFCFPTFFESETFGVVIIEAMQFMLPVISTYWRGIPSVVQEGTTGILVPVKNSEALAVAIEQFLQDSELRKKMGDAGRVLFLKKFTLEDYYHNIEISILSIIQ